MFYRHSVEINVAFAVYTNGATRGGKEELPPLWVDVQKLCNMCAFIVMELLRITRQIHCKAVEQRATLIHRQYNWSVVIPLEEMDTGSSV